MSLLMIPPPVARDELATQFAAHPAVLLLINRMKNSQVVVLCSLLRGDRLTSAGNNISADYEVLRLPAIIEILEKKYFIPVQHCNVNTTSVTARSATTQTSYVMDEGTIKRLFAEPESVFREKKKDLSAKEWVRKQRKLDDLIKNHGGLAETFLTLAHHAYKDKTLSSEEWKELEEKFRDLLNGLEAA
ncbi:hypothetical protein [Gibbsiella quercinecans]|uniref:hypothetical protein n=1 Tax=Gibbsiella quercinecans TaxID=929813 RepID=UPI003A4D79FA